MIRHLLFAIAVGCGAIGSASAAGSLVSSSHYQSLYADQRASREGDLLTVLVIESATAESQARSGGDRSFDFSASLIKDDDVPKAGLTLDHDADSQGSTTRSGAVRAQISTRVERVLESGDLEVRGVQRITINGEEQRLLVEGIVRPWDISADNAVLSTRLLNPRIEFLGEGWVNEGQKPGLLERIARFLGL
jgi:flagellar L-ring protein precursor FlgH